MYLHALTLEEFRSYRHLTIEFSPEGLGIFGANASGKSTLLEAIAMLATTRSPRTVTERDVINWQSGESLNVPPFARIHGQVVRSDREVNIEITLQADPNRSNSAKKQVKINGRPGRAMDAVGLLNAVLFSPEDVSLVSGSPAGRRRYLDLMISQLDSRYLRALSRYNRILEQRNSLLRSLLRDQVPASSPHIASQLAFWDEELIGVGSTVLARRIDTTHRLASLLAQRFAWLTDGAELGLRYLASLGDDVTDEMRYASTLADLEFRIARSYTMELHNRRGEELRRGVSLLGPHRDDFVLKLNEVDLASFGSRGQMRLAVVALKLAEADLMVADTKERPVLLLDDVLSELDEAHRHMLTNAIMEIGGQVILTTTDEETFYLPQLRNLPISKVVSGTISSVPRDSINLNR